MVRPETDAKSRNEGNFALKLKYFSSFVAVKLAKKSEGNHLLIYDCPHFFLPILLQRKMKKYFKRNQQIKVFKNQFLF